MGIPEYYDKRESRPGLYASAIVACRGSTKVHVQWFERGCVALRRFLIGCAWFPFGCCCVVSCSEICRYANAQGKRLRRVPFITLENN